MMFDQVVWIDFETYYSSDYSLSKMSTTDYIQDPRFEVIGVGVRDQDGGYDWLEEDQFREWWVPQVNWSRTAAGAHHAQFDGGILQHHFGVTPAFWFDTLSMVSPLIGMTVGGSLKKAMAHFQVGEKGDEVVRAIGKQRKDFSQDEWLRYGEYCKNDVRGSWEISEKIIEAFPWGELEQIDLTIKMYTEPVFRLDELRMQAYFVEERARKVSLLERLQTEHGLGVTKADLMSNEKFAGVLMALGVDPPQKWSVKKKRYDWAFAKSDPGFQQLKEHDDEDVRDVIEARIGTKSTINETRTERFLRAGKDGRPLRVYLKYYGAHTGRWSGGDKANWQNFEKTSKTNPKKGAIRRSILAPSGYKIVACDSGQIEARGAFWLAGQDDMLEAFRQKRDVYSELATEAYRRPIDRKKNEEDEIPGFVGKICVLGLQYGMSAIKLGMTLAAGAMGGPPVVFTSKDAEDMGVDVARAQSNHWLMDKIKAMPSRLSLEKRVVHVAVCDDLVKTYRRKNDQIVGLWDDMKEVLRMMIAGEEAVIGNGALRVVKEGLVLPNGLTLRYPGIKEEQFEDAEGRPFSEFSYQFKKGHSRIHGAALTENVIQALCRIIVADQMLEFSRRWKVALMTHDEVVAVVPESEAQEALDYLLGLMKTSPAWAPTLPLHAEGGIGDNYGECK